MIEKLADAVLDLEDRAPFSSEARIFAHNRLTRTTPPATDASGHPI